MFAPQSLDSTLDYFRCVSSNKSASVLSTRGGSDVLLLRGGSNVPDVADLAMGAYDWCGNLGAPSALVAGAVVATLYENMQSGDLALDRDDTRLVAATKKLTRMLLVSAFTLETVSIFVTTVSTFPGKRASVRSLIQILAHR